MAGSSPWAARFGAQLLTGASAPGPVEVADRLLAIQAQDPRGARLAVRARTAGLTAADVDRRLDDGSLVVTWLNRGTLHLIRSEDYPLLAPLTTPQLMTASSRRLAQEGVTPAALDRALAAITAALGSEGPLAREQLRERIAAARVRTEGQALMHILFRAALDGLVVRGPMIGRRHAYVLAAEWLGQHPRIERDRGLAELARRYLRGHGPASDRDLAKWAGITVRDARFGLTAIGSELRPTGDGGVDLKRRGGVRGFPEPRLLGSFDPVLHGWTSRQEVLGRYQRLIVSGGLFRPFVLVSGRAAGLWTIARDGAVSMSELALPARRDARALEREARDIERFLTPTDR